MNSPLPSTDLTALTSEALTSRLGQLLGNERTLLIDFLRHLGEMDRRRLCLELGYSSTFAYLTEHLRLSKASAFRRLTAARLLARFSAVAGLLADGRLCLTTLSLLKDVLTEQSAAEILERASGKTEDEVQVLVASLRPKPALPDLIRALSAGKASAEKPVPLEVRGQAPSGSGQELTISEVRRPDRQIPAPMPRRTQVTPLDEQLRVIRMTVGPQFMDELEEVKSALSHCVPAGSLEALLRECFRITLETCSRRRRGAGNGKRHSQAAVTKPAAELKQPKPTGFPEPSAEQVQATKPNEVTRGGAQAASRYLPVAVRREVWQRDGGRCAFVGANGRRCGSRHQLQFHHRRPFASGGAATVQNLGLRCAAHNQYEARLDFGDEYLDRFVQRAPPDEPAGHSLELDLFPEAPSR